jgi:hypothetical protein
VIVVVVIVVAVMMMRRRRRIELLKVGIYENVEIFIQT